MKGNTESRWDNTGGVRDYYIKPVPHWGPLFVCPECGHECREEEQNEKDSRIV